MHIRTALIALVLALSITACNQKHSSGGQSADATTVSNKATSKLPLKKIKLPEGFKIEVYAEGVKNARSIARSEKGTLFIGTRNKGAVYALQDMDNDGYAEKHYTIDKGLNMPNGVALKDGNLYVAAVSKLLRYDNIEAQLANPPAAKVVYDKYPTDNSHGWKFISFGPDGKLYIPVGAPCNICDSKKEIYASITRINPDGSGMEVVQHGVRNTVGFTWHPETKELWFTENGRDWMGDDIPACELNHAPRDGMHFGYPYCHQGDLPDPEFGDKRDCSEFTPPVQKLGPHVAPLGIEFIPAGNFPAEYTGHILIAEHGSWNRSKKIGYRVMMVKLEGSKAISYTPFAEGWLEANDDIWGRPVDLEFLPDGSLLLSDDYADAVYRIYYEG